MVAEHGELDGEGALPSEQRGSVVPSGGGPAEAHPSSYRLLFHANPHPMWVFDRETLRFLAVNDAAIHHYGYTRDEFLSMTIADIRPPEDVPRLLDSLTPFEGYEEAHVWRHRKHDGSLIWVEITAHSLTFEGRPAELILAQDVTARLDAHRAIAENEQRLKLALHGAHQGLWDWSLASGHCHMTPELEQLLGEEPGTLARHIDALRARVHEEDAQGVLEALQQAAAAGRSEFTVQYRLRRRQGDWIWVQDRASVLARDGAGRAVRIAGVIQDISAQKRSEAEREELLADALEAQLRLEEQAAELETALDALRETSEAIRHSEARYREFYEDDLTGDFVAGPDGRIVECNAAFIRMLGFPDRAAALRANLGSLCWDTAERDELIGALRAGRRLDEIEIVLRTVQGSPVHVIGNFIGLRAATGTLREIRGYLFDITERKALEARLAQAQKMETVGRLAGGIAHDFNNLLTVIRGNAQIVLMDDVADAETRECVVEIDGAAARAADLTRQLLAFSRQQVLMPRLLDLNAVMQDMHRLLQRLIGEDIRLVLELERELWPVRVDPGQLQQLVMNLAVNARDAMAHGGDLRIATRNRTLSEHEAATIRPLPGSAGEYVELVVSDNGAGMDAATCERIFEPFFTTKEQGRGTGLGLATVYGIVTQSEGRIWVDSRPDAGSTFHVLFPRVTNAEAEAELQAGGVQDVAGGSETILVVEDEPGVRAVVTRALAARGYRVVAAADAAEALTLASTQRGPIHLLLTDVVMPGVSGSVLQQRLSDRHPRMRVLFMSGYTADALDTRGVSARGLAFIQKPFTPEELLRQVRAVLDHP